jgi:hypothetical protein
MKSPEMYHEWRAQNFCGATPNFSHRATRVTVKVSSSTKFDAAWWQASLMLLEHLSRQQPSLEPWLQVLKKMGIPMSDSPLEMGYLALERAFKCPEYPSDWRIKPDGDKNVFAPGDGQAHSHLIIHLANPYRKFAHHAVRLTGMWLNWGHTVMRENRLSVSKKQLQQWRAGLDHIRTCLPEPSLMAGHFGLWQDGIPWEWLGEDRTRMGDGSLQKIVRGATKHLLAEKFGPWHIPIYTVTGSVGKTTTARLLFQLLQGSDRTLALAASDGAWIQEKRVIEGDCIGGVSAEALLRNPTVEAAVFEQGRGGIIKQGVPYARSDVGILLNIQPVHLGLDGIETLEEMADTKAVGLRPARLWVLNYDDAQCVRIAKQHPSSQTLWFSVSANSDELQSTSVDAHAALGVERDAKGAPLALTIWRAGQQIECWSLDCVRPYHGLLGEKTLEELLASVAAAYFGSLSLSKNSWPDRLRALSLDSGNHAFRTSVHRQDHAVFVLDKAGELPSLEPLKTAVDEVARTEGCEYRIVAFCRSAGEVPSRHLESAQFFHGLVDEFVCFDRPDTYTSKVALPIYAPGSIPALLRNEFIRLNHETGDEKPVSTHENWTEAEVFLRQRLAQLTHKTLVLVNQPATAATELNQQILEFATTGLTRSGSLD